MKHKGQKDTMFNFRFFRFCLTAALLACAAAGMSAPPAQAPLPKAAEPEATTLTPQATAFLKAIESNNVALVRQDLKADSALANLPILFYKGNTGRVSVPPLFQAAEDNNTEVMMLLLQAGAKANVEDFFTGTPLDQAAFFGGKEAVGLLLAHGADIEHQDHSNRTALYRAVEAGNADTLALLLAHGANVNACDLDGKSPLAVALDPPNPGPNHAAVLALLRRHGAKAKTLTPLEAAFLKAIDDSDAASVKQDLKVNPALANLPPTFDTGSRDDMSELPVLKAARNNDVQVMALLLKAGAKADAENDYGDTALNLAAFHDDADMITLLLAHGADIARRSSGLGQTALHQAVEGDHPGIVTLLLAHGANVNARNESGETPLALDSRSDLSADHAAILKLLRQHGGH